MNKIRVNLKEHSYDVLIGTDILPELGKIVEANNWGKEIFLITDPLVNDLYGDRVSKGFKGKLVTIETKRGENHKTLAEAAKVFDQLVRHGAHRDSLIVALGGGVVGDLAGFVAANYMRGIPYIQVPTTLLAQVDAAIGGKTAVNHPKGKNLIGAFYQPRLVFVDVKSLTSLPARELRTGLAEIVKYGMIKDASFFKFLEENAHHLHTRAFEKEDTLRAAMKLWQTIVVESAKIKAEVVEKDEKEAKLRMILNFGHTFGHAIESLTHYRSYNHGEAVAIGMVAAALVAQKLGILDPNVTARLRQLLDKLGLPSEIKNFPVSKLIAGINIDKKVLGGKVNFVLPEKLGKVIIRDNVPLPIIRKTLLELGAK
ncbi:MAG: 3-dehydroquinate synthase [Candidatus Margulisbacteria bacterium]|nr:3-dehydroquinate synthase [Candidatus Margulisiibacteriota bacterium]MBU1616910.1 3-dehydroquinate synthase [Candidatus Margulisiibacteriota bacterium]